MKRLNYLKNRVVIVAILVLVPMACENEFLKEPFIEDIKSSKMILLKSMNDTCRIEPVYLTLYTRDHVDVGYVSITNDDDSVYVKYLVDDGWLISEAQLFIGAEEDIPLDNDGVPDIENFTYVNKFDPRVMGHEYVHPISELDSCYIVLAHAKVGQCDDEPDDCGECDGKATELTLRYDGDTDAQITVEQRKDNIVIFDGFVNAGEEFSFVGTLKGTMGPEIIIKVNGYENTRIHTSCSEPLYIGLVSGDFTVVDGYSRNGGRLCHQDPPPEGDCHGCEGKVTWLTMTYNGDSKALITVRQKKDNVVVFDDSVAVGGDFFFMGTDKGTLGTEIYLSINGEENTSIHTSCSEPIYIGMTSGLFTIVDGYSRNGGQLCMANGGEAHLINELKCDEPEPPNCEDVSVWADGGITFEDFFHIEEWGYLGEYCIVRCLEEPEDMYFTFKFWIMTTDGSRMWGVLQTDEQFYFQNDWCDYMGVLKLTCDTTLKIDSWHGWVGEVEVINNGSSIVATFSLDEGYSAIYEVYAFYGTMDELLSYGQCPDFGSFPYIFTDENITSFEIQID